MFLILSVFLLASCNQDEADHWLNDPESATALIIKSSDQLVIDGHTLNLHAELWRDFMPVTLPGGKGLISLNWLVKTDSTAMPDYLMLSKQFVIYQDQVWAAEYTDETRESPNYLMERISRDGPHWEAETEVTVVAEVTNSQNNTRYYVRSAKQVIHAVY